MAFEMKTRVSSGPEQAEVHVVSSGSGLSRYEGGHMQNGGYSGMQQNGGGGNTNYMPLVWFGGAAAGAYYLLGEALQIGASLGKIGVLCGLGFLGFKAVMKGRRS